MNILILCLSCLLFWVNADTDIDLRNIGVDVHIQHLSLNTSILLGYVIEHFGKLGISAAFDLTEMSYSKQETSLCYNDSTLITQYLTRDSSPLDRNTAFKYVDATAKIPPGIMQLALVWVGDYQECKAIDPLKNPRTNNTFQGKYFTAGLYYNGKPFLQEQPLFVGFCLPDSCNSSEVMKLINIGLNCTNLTVDTVISDEDVKLESGAIASLIIIGCFVFFVLLGTIVDILASKVNSDRKTLVQDLGEPSDRVGLLLGEYFYSQTIQSNQRRCNIKDMFIQFCQSFSIVNNSKKLFNTPTAVGPLACLNGLRVLSMWWVILGHTYALAANTVIMDNILEAAKIIQRLSFQPIVNGTFSVDTFFFLSGLLVAYIALKELNEKGTMKWIYFFVHRYCRLTPMYAFVILYFTFLFIPTMNSGGPLQFAYNTDSSKKFSDVCKAYWWTNLLYINNFYPYYGNIGTTCMGWTWYLANDMQFYIFISPIVIIMLHKRRIFGFLIVGGLIGSCVVTTFALVWYYGIYDVLQMTVTKHTDDPMAINGPIYARPYTRWSVYIIGMTTGYCLVVKNDRIHMHRLFALMGWCASIATALAIIYGQYYYFHNPGMYMTLWESSFYISLSRTAWGVCLCWIVLACVAKKGGYVADILSWKIWAPLGRLTYSAYLVHPIVIFTYYLRMLKPLHFSDLTMTYMFLGHLVMSYVVAFIVSMIVEAPLLQLEKLMLKRTSKD